MLRDNRLKCQDRHRVPARIYCFAAAVSMCISLAFAQDTRVAEVEWVSEKQIVEAMAAAGPSDKREQHLACHLRPGLIHRWIKRPQVLINVFELSLADPALQLKLVKAPPTVVARERIENMADHLIEQGMSPLAGVNGGFWDSSMRPLGVLASDKQIFTAGNHQWTFLKDTEGVYLGEATVAKSAIINFVRMNLTGFNAMNPTSGNYLYTEEFGPKVPALETPASIIRVKLDAMEKQINAPFSGTIVELFSGIGQYPIEDGEAWIVCTKPLSADLTKAIEVDARVKFEIMAKPRKTPIEVAVSAGPMLVDEGQLILDTTSGEAKSLAAAAQKPRTALGVSQDGATLFLATMEGIRSGFNSGVTLKVLSEEMIRLGAWKAMNLDGGSSTCAWAYGKRISRPAPLIGLRPISNALFIIDAESKGVGVPPR